MQYPVIDDAFNEPFSLNIDYSMLKKGNFKALVNKSVTHWRQQSPLSYSIQAMFEKSELWKDNKKTMLRSVSVSKAHFLNFEKHD